MCGEHGDVAAVPIEPTRYTKPTADQHTLVTPSVLYQYCHHRPGHLPATCLPPTSKKAHHRPTPNPIDPGDLLSNMRYFPRISPKFRATIHIQSLTKAYIFIKTKSFPLRFKGNFMGLNLIYCTLVCG